MRQIFIDSRDRVSGTSTDFSIQLPETLVIEGAGHRMRVDSLRVPNVFATIQAGVNDTFVVVEGATPYTVNLTVGNYDGPALQTMIQAVLVASGAPGAWTVDYDVTNIAMSISCTNAFTITQTVGFAIQLFAHPYTQTASSYAFTYVSTLGLDILYLCSGRFSTVSVVGPKGSHDTLMCGVVDQPYGSVMVFDMPWDTWIDVPAVTAQQLDFQLRERNYNLLSITPNISFVLTIA